MLMRRDREFRGFSRSDLVTHIHSQATEIERKTKDISYMLAVVGQVLDQHPDTVVAAMQAVQAAQGADETESALGKQIEGRLAEPIPALAAEPAGGLPDDPLWLPKTESGARFELRLVQQDRARVEAISDRRRARILELEAEVLALRTAQPQVAGGRAARVLIVSWRGGPGAKDGP
jgi:hypothetical protein